MSKPIIKNIPLIFACDLPNSIRYELNDWNSDLCFHGGNCVFTIRPEELWSLPLFVLWMVKNQAWTLEQIDLPWYEKYCAERNLRSEDMSNYMEYLSWKGKRDDFLTVAMIGT